MMWDFGLDPAFFNNWTAINDKIAEVDSTFDLVLITEKFQESMVLLKNLLCWDYGDLTSLKLNAHDASTKSSLSGKARAKLKTWLWADYQLYDHFLAKFNNEIESFDGLNHEMEILGHANHEVQDHCVVAQVSNEELDPQDRLSGHGVLGFKINSEDTECSYMGMKEVKFLEIIRSIQTKRSEDVSGIKFKPIEPNLKPLGSHLSIDMMKTMFKHKGP